MMTNEGKPLSFRIARIAMITAALLLAILATPANWSPADFVIMGILLFSIGAAYELIVTRVDHSYRIAVGAGLVLLFLLVWAELAVGVFGSPFAGS